MFTLKNLAAVAFASLAAMSFANSQIILNNFDDWSAANPNGGFESGSWIGNVTQDSGFITIAGTADSEGYLYADVIGTAPKDLGLFSQISLTARINTGNTTPSYVVTLADSNGDTVASATFFATDFSSSFSTVTKTLSIAVPLKMSDIGGFLISGEGISADDSRLSVDNLSAVPEPATWALLAGSLTITTLLRRRRRA